MSDPSKIWPVTWEANRQAQAAAALAASPAERLAWLEEMIAFAHRAGALGDAAARSAARQVPIEDAPAEPTRDAKRSES